MSNSMHDNIIIGRLDGREVYSTGNTQVPGCCAGCREQGFAEPGHFACSPPGLEAYQLLDSGHASMDLVDGSWRYMVDVDGFKLWYAAKKRALRRDEEAERE